MKIKIIMKSGYEVPVECETLNYKVHKDTGELLALTIDKAVSSYPCFISVAEIACIIRDTDGEKRDVPAK